MSERIEAMTWFEIHRRIYEVVCGLTSSNIPVSLGMPDGSVLPMSVRDVRLVWSGGRPELRVDLNRRGADLEALYFSGNAALEKTSEKPSEALDTDVEDMIQCGAKS